MHWIQTHGIDALIIYLAYSALVSPMPEPTPASGPGYRYLYGVAHSIAGNLKNVAKAVSPVSLATVTEDAKVVVQTTQKPS